MLPPFTHPALPSPPVAALASSHSPQHQHCRQQPPSCCCRHVLFISHSSWQRSHQVKPLKISNRQTVTVLTKRRHKRSPLPHPPAASPRTIFLKRTPVMAAAGRRCRWREKLRAGGAERVWKSGPTCIENQAMEMSLTWSWPWRLRALPWRTLMLRLSRTCCSPCGRRRRAGDAPPDMSCA
jgi:hypothetical protein